MVTHPRINESIRVKTSNEVCTTVERISQPMFRSMNPNKPLGTMCYPVYIVATENLMLCENTPTEASVKAPVGSLRSLQSL